MERAQRYMDEEEEEDEALPFEGLEKTTALQHSRVFLTVPLRKTKSIEAIRENLYLIFTGVAQLTESEATELFFNSTRLLQSDHPKLRRLHYVLMKELSPQVEQSFIASNSLMNDINSHNTSTKCNAIRTLYKVMDSSMLGMLDRTITTALTSESAKVVNAAIAIGLHIAQSNPELVRRWGSQTAEVIRNKRDSQYLAIALLHKLRKGDRLSVSRLVDDARKEEIGSPLALCLLVKMCTELMKENFSDSKPLYQFVLSKLKHSNDMVVFEAIKSICSLTNISAEDVKPAVMVCNLYLTSLSAVHRFTAIRLLNQVATINPLAVEPINSEIEKMLPDSNRICATLAITTLLKTGTDSTIDRLVGQLSGAGYLNELGDEFKMVIVDSMRVLNAKFPHKYSVLLAFLFKALSDDGSSQLKESIIDTMIDISKMNPKSNESVLLHLAEFIDDCEFPQITKRVLMYLGEEAGSTQNPRKFVRYVYNHATLESAEIRAVAVSTLAKLAARVPSLRRPIVTLLRRTAHDPDDEVRDRAVLYTQIFEFGDEMVVRSMISDVANAVAALRAQAAVAARPKALQSNAAAVAAASRQATSAADEQGGAAALSAADGSFLSESIMVGRDHLRKIKQLRQLGEPLSSSEPELLTEKDSEYEVYVIKHIYATHIALQFKVSNTMDNLIFEKVSIVTETEELEAEPRFAIPIERVMRGSPQYSYIVLEYEENMFPRGTVNCQIQLTVKNDEDEDGDEEMFEIQSFDVNISDFINPVNLGDQFAAQWDQLNEEETDGTYSLEAMANLTVAASELVDFFGMYVEGGKPQTIKTTSHTLNMAGALANSSNTLILVRARVFITSNETVALQLSIRGGEEEVRNYLASALLS